MYFSIWNIFICITVCNFLNAWSFSVSLMASWFYVCSPFFSTFPTPNICMYEHWISEKVFIILWKVIGCIVSCSVCIICLPFTALMHCIYFSLRNTQYLYRVKLDFCNWAIWICTDSSEKWLAFTFKYIPLKAFESLWRTGLWENLRKKLFLGIINIIQNSQFKTALFHNPFE